MPATTFAHLLVLYLSGALDHGVPIGRGIFFNCDDCGRPE
jgi:hypothetical protein